MDEAQHLADRVVVVRDGHVVADGTPDALGAGQPLALVSFRAPAGVDAAALPLPVARDVEAADGRIAFRTPAPTRDLAPLVAWAAARDTELDGLTVTRPSLEDVYLELTQEEASA
jgi:ABC-2 type transport system ATP-binding protein